VSPTVGAEGEILRALGRLDALTRRLRRECPWDREQDERSIVPHTVEEAYELADAAARGDDARLLDELGDVLFQVHFLALLLEERGAGDLAAVADHTTEKLIRRHPHVFGTRAAADSAAVLATWEEVKGGEAGRAPGIFGEVPENLPGLLLARKVQRRAASSGFDWGAGARPGHPPGPDGPSRLTAVREELAEVEEALAGRGGAESTVEGEIGDLLFAVVALARGEGVDPELALRGTTARFRERVQAAEERAGAHGERWSELPPARQLEHYNAARRAGSPSAKERGPQS
jgi:MazG family protein